MEFIELLGVAGVSVFILMTLFWGISVIRKDASIVDVAWGMGFILISAVTMFINVSFVERSWILMVLVLLWGMRLAVHIFLRNRERGEDWRYVKWRREWGKNFLLKSYFKVFLLQGVLMLLVATPIVFGHYKAQSGLQILDFVGVGVWIIGFLFETIADYQLAKFKSDPKNKGKLITSGLWKFSRHPNYFGEVTMWWGVFLIVLSLPDGVFAIIGPLTITYLILFVSGVPMLEKKLGRKREFKKYQQETSMFIPWFPRKKMSEKV